jgi:hypothetical protein
MYILASRAPTFFFGFVKFVYLSLLVRRKTSGQLD